MAKQDSVTAVTIEDLPLQELTPAQAEAVNGGLTKALTTDIVDPLESLILGLGTDPDGNEYIEV